MWVHRYKVDALFSGNRLQLSYWQTIESRVLYALEHYPWVQLQLIIFGSDPASLSKAAAGTPIYRYAALYAQARFSAFTNVQVACFVPATPRFLGQGHASFLAADLLKQNCVLAVTVLLLRLSSVTCCTSQFCVVNDVIMPAEVKVVAAYMAAAESWETLLTSHQVSQLALRARSFYPHYESLRPHFYSGSCKCKCHWTCYV
jgi:hypothetical protein